ncbi:hypothetical protein [Spiroplasma sp. AdecLV25b]|uniref:hypothetical protein n=1 Tax=Spiroplasma sp. AdecLV25b TaxID=3027162 RepID=UPI0027E1680B|nr:hypothetical protein [Spiroplasma sp. AdecLV25b]
MKKILRFFTFFSSLLIVTINSLLVTGCSLFVHDFNRNDNVSMLQYYIPGEHDFILKYETEIANKASDTSINEFNNLYDNITSETKIIWQDYASLQKDLLKTKMGIRYSETNWDQLLNQEKLTNAEKAIGEKNILRLYNIIGSLYSKDVVTKLIQNISEVPLNNNIVAWTNYNPIYNNLRVGFDSQSFNTSFIDQEYRQGWWASDDIISIVAHEFGHALSIYLNLDNAKRATFNDNWNVNSNNDNCNLVPSVPKNNSSSAQLQHSIPNCVDYFMQYLNEISNVVITHDLEKVLFPLVVVRSNFGRGYWVNSNMDIPPDELFAEAFNEWILTPEVQRNWNWELLNDFFMDYLPKAFK